MKIKRPLFSTSLRSVHWSVDVTRKISGFLLLVLPVLLFAQSPLQWVKDHPATITYTLDLTNVQQHELDITVDFPAVPTGAFTVRMPTSSPGRYAEHNFAKNVYDLKAYDGKGAPIYLSQEGINEWIITGHDGRVKLTYTLFANGGDGTYSGVDNRKLHLNMPASFVYGDKLNDRPVQIVIPADQRPDWQVASQLEDLGDRHYAAPDYYYFYDSPTMVGDIHFHRFEASGSATIEVAFMGDSKEENRAAYLEWVEQIVAEQARVYGELPDFDFGRYTFLCSYNPYIGGDGMEHRNSTICSAPVGLDEYADRLIGTVSHEFFHCWNVERIRPAHLEPFDFDHANQSGELWFAEGFTSYYDDLTLVRTGIITPEAYFNGLGNTLNYVYLRPGRGYRNPIEMSQQAPFVDAATANDEDNFDNTFVSYYPYGAVLGLVLDLELREMGHTLDELMQLIWERYGRTEIPYHVNDLQLALADLTESPDWAADWFSRHVHGSDLPDIEELMAPFGLEVNRAPADSVTLQGLRVRNDSEDNTGVRISQKVRENHPFYAAGLDRGSVISSLNGEAVNNVEDVKRILGTLQVGEAYRIGYVQLGLDREESFSLSADPRMSIKISEAENDKRKAWIGQ